MPKRPDMDYHSSYAEPPTLSPLAIMLTAMRRKFADNDFDGAVAIARIAAPYLHPRVPAAAPAPEFSALPDADLDAFNAPD